MASELSLPTWPIRLPKRPGQPRIPRNMVAMSSIPYLPRWVILTSTILWCQVCVIFQGLMFKDNCKPTRVKSFGILCSKNKRGPSGEFFLAIDPPKSLCKSVTKCEPCVKVLRVVRQWCGADSLASARPGLGEYILATSAVCNSSPMPRVRLGYLSPSLVTQFKLVPESILISRTPECTSTHGQEGHKLVTKKGDSVDNWMSNRISCAIFPLEPWFEHAF